MTANPRRIVSSTSTSPSPSSSSSSSSSSSFSSSSHTRPSNAQDDVDWLGFLRTVGRTLPPDSHPPPPPSLPPPSFPSSSMRDRSDAADRKRRHTGSESPRRSYPYPSTYHVRPGDDRPPAALTFTSGQPGSSRETYIDPTGPSPRLRSSGGAVFQVAERTGPTDGRESDPVLPKWQPDHQASSCPVCRTDFTFLFRRHHCRKCGRVVCANCSLHRITIPRQYIVQPSHVHHEDAAAAAASSPSSRSNPALGGGDVVRVCNPCVPDPWTPDSVTTPSSPAAVSPTLRPSGDGEALWQFPSRNPRLQLHRGQHTVRESSTREGIERYRYVSELPEGRSRSNLYQPSPGIRPSHTPSPISSSYSSRAHTGPFPRLTQRSGHRYSHSSGDRPMPPSRPLPPASVVEESLAPPRREIREEDECPVCGMAMEPGESVREAHIQDCIASRFSSSPFQLARPAPLSASTTADPLASGSSASPAPGSSRPRAFSYRSRGMALYKATEKDCSTEDGEPQECVICFEEFQPGDDMGRMECLCKFHRLCIRQWWDTKGQGSCPTHQLHG